jgi:hypothetical protein
MEDVAKTGALNSGGFTLDEVVVQFDGILSMRQDAIYWLRVRVRCDSTATTGAGRPDRGANAKPCSVTVKYGRIAQFWEGFLGYTGITATAAGLYLGPLEQTIELVQGP